MIAIWREEGGDGSQVSASLETQISLGSLTFLRVSNPRGCYLNKIFSSRWKVFLTQGLALSSSFFFRLHITTQTLTSARTLTCANKFRNRGLYSYQVVALLHSWLLRLFHFIDQLGIGYDRLRGHRVIEVRFRHKCDFEIERTLSQAKALLTVLAMLYKHYI